MGMYTNKKLIGKDVLEARYHNNALALYLPLQQDWKQATDAVAALDEMIVWLSEVRDYVLSQSNITPKFMQIAFDARTIVECKAAALRGMAITEVRAITAMGLLFVRSALDIRWTETEPFGAVRAGGEWIPLTMLGLETWAAEEGLNWRRDDGTVVLWQQTVGGGGSGDHALHGDDAIIVGAAMEYLSRIPSATMDDVTIHTLLAIGAFLMNPHSSRAKESAVEAADRFFCSFVPVETGGGGGVGSFYGDYYEVERVSEYSVKLIKAWAEAHIVSLGTKQTLALIELVANALGDSFHAGFENGWEERDQCEVDELDLGEEVEITDFTANAGGGGGTDHKPLHSLTAAEAREYAQVVIAQAVAMCSELNNIPGVSVKVEFEVIEDDTKQEPDVEVTNELGNFRMFTLGRNDFEFRFPSGGKLDADSVRQLLSDLEDFYTSCEDELYCTLNPGECDEDEDGAA